VSADTVWRGAPGEPLPKGVTLRITDSHGEPVAGAAVWWEPIGFNSRVMAPSPLSNSDGVATGVWQLGSRAAEEQQLHVLVQRGSLRGELTLRARAVPHVVAQLRVSVDTPAVVRLGDSLLIALTAIDPFGNEFPAPAPILAVDDTNIGRVLGTPFITAPRVEFPAPAPGLAVADTTIRRVVGAAIITGPRRGFTYITVSSGRVNLNLPLHVVQYVASILSATDTLSFTSLGERLPIAYTVRDDRGRVVADTIATVSIADTAVAQVADSLVRAAGPGMTDLQLAIHSVRTTVPVTVQQRVASLRLDQDTIRFDALFDTTTISPIARDSLGFSVPHLADVVFRSADPNVVAVDSNGVLRSKRNGSALVIVESLEGPADTAYATVSQKPAAILVSSAADTINMLGGSTRVQANVVDRNRMTVPDIAIAWKSLDLDLIDVDVAGRVTSRAVGLGRVQASVGDVIDTVVVVVRQAIASVSLAALADTLSIGGAVNIVATATDSNGFQIPDPQLGWESSDSSVVNVRNGNATGIAPGTAVINARSGQIVASVDVVVEGVAIYVNGARSHVVGVLNSGDSVVITNGRLRLQLSQSSSQHAAIIADARVGEMWCDMTARLWGDWTYVASSVFTPPTRVEILTNTNDEIGVKWTFGDHWFLPKTAGFPDDYSDTPYPFEKTVWLRRAEQGYYALVRPLAELPPEATGVEHEIGFGGLWGGGTIRASGVALLVDTLSSTIRYDPQTIDASDFLLRGDPLRRVLVSLDGVAMLVPWFWSQEYGGVVVHSLPSAPYGAYLYATSISDTTTARSVCEKAAREAPFPIPSFTTDALGRCGPEP